MLHIIYTTITDHAAAKTLAHRLVTQKLVACANILPQHTAIYEYDGKLCEEGETGLWCKVPSQGVEQAIAAIKRLHPYETPCIIAWPASHTAPDFLAWAIEAISHPL